MVYCVGLTGNIASGKSTVGDIFSQLGVTVLSADKVSKELTRNNSTAYKEIIARYGASVLLQDGTLNRHQLRTIIFSDTSERLWLENLLHPLIRQQLAEQVSLCTGSYCIVEIPLLINKEAYPYLDRILLITAPLEIKIARIIERDQCTKEQALAILSTQPDNKERLKNADDVLLNDAGIAELKHAVEKLHQKYLRAC